MSTDQKLIGSIQFQSLQVFSDLRNRVFWDYGDEDASPWTPKSSVTLCCFGSYRCFGGAGLLNIQGTEVQDE